MSLWAPEAVGQFTACILGVAERVARSDLPDFGNAGKPILYW